MVTLFKYAIGCCKKKKKEILHCLQCPVGIVKGKKNKNNELKIGAWEI